MGKDETDGFKSVVPADKNDRVLVLPDEGENDSAVGVDRVVIPKILRLILYPFTEKPPNADDLCDGDKSGDGHAMVIQSAVERE